MVVAAALTAIILGWNLFTRAIIIDQSGTISVGDWKVELKSVGPGIFFSLFGTIVLVYVLLKPAQYSVSASPSPEPTVSVTAVGSPGPTIAVTAMGVGTPSDLVTRSYVRAVNTIVQIQAQIAAQPAGSAATLLSAQASDLADATHLLEQYRLGVLVQKFGPQRVSEWEKYGTTYRNSKRTLPLDVKNELEPIAPWFTETVTDEKSRAQ
jgi:hypothetical protein